MRLILGRYAFKLPSEEAPVGCPERQIRVFDQDIFASFMMIRFSSFMLCIVMKSMIVYICGLHKAEATIANLPAQVLKVLESYTRQLQE